MTFQARLTCAFVAFIAAFFYVNLFSKPADQRQTRPKLYEATSNEVVAAFGQPFRVVDSTNFVEVADAMAEEGSPVSTDDTRAKGFVWLYPEGANTGGAARRYRTVFFDSRNRVYSIQKTYWMRDVWERQ